MRIDTPVFRVGIIARVGGEAQRPAVREGCTFGGCTCDRAAFVMSDSSRIDWDRIVERVIAAQGLEVAPLRVRVGLPIGVESPFGPDREAEVCLVLRHASDLGQRFAVMTKPFYPAGVWRLPTGGIEAGEELLQAFARELREETGLTSEGRLIAHVVYEVDGSAAFHTFAFVIEWDGSGLESRDPDEVMAFATASLEELEAQAAWMAALAPGWSVDLEQDWGGWGWQRASMQRGVIEALRGASEG